MSAAQAGGAGGEEEMDLTKPGKLWARAEWEKDTTFHLVVPQAGYTKNNLTLNPTINPMDELMRPWTVSWQDAEKDKEDNAYCDLDASGRANEIMAKLEERYARGEKRLEKVRGVYIATARDGNRVPDAQVAETKDFKLVSIPSIQIKPIIDTLTPLNFEGKCCACPRHNKKAFSIDLHVTGDVTEVEISTNPAVQITAAPGGTGKGTLKVAVKEFEKYVVSVPASFTSKGESKWQAVPRRYVRFVPGGWRRGETDQQSFTRTIYTGGFITMTIRGTGKNKNLVKAITFKAESWASAWLAGPLPPAFYHNVC